MTAAVIADIRVRSSRWGALTQRRMADIAAVTCWNEPDFKGPRAKRGPGVRLRSRNRRRARGRCGGQAERVHTRITTRSGWGRSGEQRQFNCTRQSDRPDQQFANGGITVEIKTRSWLFWQSTMPGGTMRRPSHRLLPITVGPRRQL
jgi:hypothetical protein